MDIRYEVRWNNATAGPFENKILAINFMNQQNKTNTHIEYSLYEVCYKKIKLVTENDLDNYIKEFYNNRKINKQIKLIGLNEFKDYIKGKFAMEDVLKNEYYMEQNYTNLLSYWNRTLEKLAIKDEDDINVVKVRDIQIHTVDVCNNDGVSNSNDDTIDSTDNDSSSDNFIADVSNNDVISYNDDDTIASTDNDNSSNNFIADVSNNDVISYNDDDTIDSTDNGNSSNNFFADISIESNNNNDNSGNVIVNRITEEFLKELLEISTIDIPFQKFYDYFKIYEREKEEGKKYKRPQLTDFIEGHIYLLGENTDINEINGDNPDTELFEALSMRHFRQLFRYWIQKNKLIWNVRNKDDFKLDEAIKDEIEKMADEYIDDCKNTGESIKRYKLKDFRKQVLDKINDNIGNALSYKEYWNRYIDTQVEIHNLSIETHNVSIETHNVSIETHNVSIETHNVSIETHNLIAENENLTVKGVYGNCNCGKCLTKFNQCVICNIGKERFLQAIEVLITEDDDNLTDKESMIGNTD